ncbi:MAG TPA: GTPase ObgE [Thermoleophilia bacterium]|nr:GTPase ObgE [Thermoleophilia bacterium]
MLDRASICVRGGHGGNGSMSFRREKYVPKGGPDGGDGAPGGDVVLVATRQLHDLSHFRHKHHFRAANGGAGRGANKRGADGPELLVQVPVGTEVRDAGGELLGDLVREGQRLRVARGGEGGRGNVCFKSSTRQAPKFAERGLEGEELWLTLSLKLLADIGLVGLPNAGKSSLLAALTRAHPKIAAYPFTTIDPNLGVLYLGEGTAVIADIPGLIEGASEGAGLGHRFLAHIERTALLLYVLDGGDGADAWPAALDTLRGELGAFRTELLERPAVVVVNKRDLLDEAGQDAAEGFLAGLRWPAATAVASAQTGDGLKALVRTLTGVMEQARAAQSEAEAAAEAAQAATVLRPAEGRLDSFTVEPVDDYFVVRGAQMERLFAKADLDNADAVAYLQQVIERVGLNDALRRAGAVPGDTVVVGEAEFEFA